MTSRLFAYGTLQFADIFAAVTGLEAEGVPATLAGFRCEGIRGEVYPAIRVDASAQVAGRVYHGLSRPALAALDRFEGDEYRRRVVTVVREDGRRQQAWCYVIAPRWQRRLDGRAWDPAQFERLHRSGYLRRLRSDLS
ncbi:MAG: gamma-glutamylcyclotransferase [Gammaproteobacteria bacterium]|nr:gamma-glutamylcyclotransferase [Gammaproteobacteria bacterium]